MRSHRWCFSAFLLLIGSSGAYAQDFTVRVPQIALPFLGHGNVQADGEMTFKSLEIKNQIITTDALLQINMKKVHFDRTLIEFINTKFLPYEVKDKGFIITAVDAIELNPQPKTILIDVDFETVGNLKGRQKISFAISKSLLHSNLADSVVQIVPGSVNLGIGGWSTKYIIPLPGFFERITRTQDNIDTERALNATLEKTANSQVLAKWKPSYLELADFDIVRSKYSYGFKFHSKIAFTQNDFNKLIAPTLQDNETIVQGLSDEKGPQKIVRDTYPKKRSMRTAAPTP